MIPWTPGPALRPLNRRRRPLAPHLDDDRLWHADRASVARAVAIGLFIDLLIPVLQFLFAIVIAIFMRAHVAIAAAATLITNPFTFAPIYWLAWWLGSGLLGLKVDEPPNLAPPENAGLTTVDPSAFWRAPGSRSRRSARRCCWGSSCSPCRPARWATCWCRCCGGRAG